MKILILGGGATGGYFGGKLAKGGADVTFLVRPKRREQLQRDGIRIESPLGNVETPVAAITRDEIKSPFNAVMLTSKAYDLDDAIETIRPAVGDTTLVLPLLNGMKHLDRLDEEFGKARVLGGTCHISVVMTPEGIIRHLSPFGSLTQGPRFADQQAASEMLAKDLSKGGFDARHSEDVVGAMWEKWVLLATLAASTCLMRASIGEISSTGKGAKFISDIIDECCAIAAASGYPQKPATLAVVRMTLTDPKSAITASMLRDIERGGRIEVDHIVGDLIRRGHENGVPTPLLEIAYVHLQAYQNRLTANTPVEIKAN